LLRGTIGSPILVCSVGVIGQWIIGFTFIRLGGCLAQARVKLTDCAHFVFIDCGVP
jgi:hypothetical protein